MKQKLVKSLLAVAAVPALVAVASAPAQADGWVTWKNVKTGNYLLFDGNGNVKGGWAAPGTSWDYDWYDFQNSDGSYNEAPGGGNCLTGYYRQVYTESCNARRDQTNWWQRWYEISTSTGWKLKNRETGYILDDEGHGGIYANVNDVNSSQNQRWR
ncbi:hypothetical protein ACH4UM_19765 [Streptomyces sp. NPDC020801]|uniref:hypothetical protein n=1 Tax=unclassified Streptomyces TaxID=2593676 RepID=UPI0037B97147